MDVRFLPRTGGVQDCDAAALSDLLRRDDGFVWIDVPEYDDAAERCLAEQLGVHDLARKACRERNHMPSAHAYKEHVFVVTHAPDLGDSGHVHLLELDQFVAHGYLVTVHGPLNPAVPVDHALADTQQVLARLRAGRLAPTTPMELSYAIMSAVVRRQRAAVDAVAKRIPELEQRVMTGSFRSPEALLEELFLRRHELLTVRTMAAQSHEVWARLSHLGRHVAAEDLPLVADVADQFDRVRSFSDGEKEFLLGVIELYQTKVTTKMTVAMERLAVLAAVTLPVTAIASVYGMNVIVNDQTHVPQLLLVLAVMLAICVLLLRWTKRQGWW